MIEKEILNLLSEIRKRGISQSDLVIKARLSSEARLSRILRGRCWPTKDEIIRMSIALDVQPEFMDFNLDDNDE